ncbi:glycerol-3-phosphate 1-O-acyltransferase PlsY [Pseudomarimonas salicorniae]|uniref:Glycerol-3-phosphate acyltransferase n=1 Tax=Pseudomarimonas salicorniae TaxID=2933270 RepID=A0ABT0GCJ0_9GAMM|nr:glycerol-3-phosphate 1-O-acyltransferase PlsY [Lysobacter sp. CAU 1642]
MILALCLLAAYLLGSLSGSLLLGRLQGFDIRTQGSGNAGGTNAFRTRGWRFALGVVLIDIGKGALAACLPVWLGSAPLPLEQAVAGCVLLAVAGHVWPVFYGLRGGKGAATLIGGLLVMWPMSVPVLLGVWVLCLLATGYVGLSTILAAVALVPWAWFDPGPSPGLRLGFAVAAALFILYTHRSNLARLRAGTEHRFEKARLIGRLRRR